MTRPATVHDAEAIARIHVRTWQVAYEGIVPADYLAGLSEQQRTEWWRPQLERNRGNVLVALTDDAVTGWVSFGPGRDDDAMGRAEIFAIYVSPALWGGGIGRRLMEAAEAALAGTRGLTLWVLEQNRRARRFYAAAGFIPDGRRQEITLGGAGLREIRFAKTFRGAA